MGKPSHGKEQRSKGPKAEACLLCWRESKDTGGCSGEAKGNDLKPKSCGALFPAWIFHQCGDSWSLERTSAVGTGRALVSDTPPRLSCPLPCNTTAHAMPVELTVHATQMSLSPGFLFKADNSCASKTSLAFQ